MFQGDLKELKKVCECRTGFSYDRIDLTCKDIDECESDTNYCGDPDVAQCTNLPIVNKKAEAAAALAARKSATTAGSSTPASSTTVTRNTSGDSLKSRKFECKCTWGDNNPNNPGIEVCSVLYVLTYSDFNGPLKMKGFWLFNLKKL